MPHRPGTPTPAAPSPAPAESRLRHLGVSFLSRNATELGYAVFSIDCSVRDRLVDVPVMRRGSELLIGARSFPPPVGTIREGLPVIRTGEESPGCNYFLGAAPKDGGARLGGRYLPSAGSAVETVTLLERSITPEQLHSEGLTAISPQQVLSWYLEGGVMDLQLLLAALRVADRYQLPLSLPIQLTPPQTHSSSGHSEVLRVSGAGLTELLRTPPTRDDQPWRLQCNTAPAPSRPFIQEVAITLGSGESSTALIRRGVDAVDVAAYHWEDGEVRMVLKRGIRPTLYVGAELRGENPESCSVALEGIAESLEGELTIAAIEHRAAEGVREEGGIQPVGPARYLGSCFPARERNAERVFNCLVEVDCSAKSGAAFTLDERLEVLSVPVAEIIALADAGVIHDPRLELNARLLRRLAGR